MIAELSHDAMLYKASHSILTAIFQVNLHYPVFIEAKDDGSGGGNC